MGILKQAETMMEFQVVLLAAGTGSRMYPLTSEDYPKHLLSIANRPMISYQLEMLEKTGFREVIVVTSQGSSITEQFLKEYKGPLKLILVPIAQNLGTAEAVLQAKKYLKNDFLVVSSDLILDGSFLRDMLDIHRIQDASMTMLGKKIPDLSEYQDVIGLEDIVEQENLKKLIVFFPAANSESTTSAVQIPRLSLVHHPHVTLYNKILDAHLYVFSHWVLQMMSDLPDPKSIKCSLLPKLIELQNNAHNQELIGGTLPKEALLDPLETASAMSVRRGHKTNRLNCMVYLLDEKTYCGRANTSKSFMEINRDVAKGITSFTPLETANSRGAFISESSTVDKTTTIGPQSIVGESTTVGTKCSVKHSIIGKNCVIGDRVKVTNSIVLDNVKIEDEVVINNSIVCSDSILQSQSNISASTIDYNTTVLPSSFVKSQILRNDHIES